MAEERLSVAEAAERAGVDEDMIRFWIDFAYFPSPRARPTSAWVSRISTASSCAGG